ncbi:hypothetical protein C2U68_19890 [Methylomonas koyamae]|nr:hypothetical protein C2U68_19890 [Methylomonas koyamae]
MWRFADRAGRCVPAVAASARASRPHQLSRDCRRRAGSPASASRGRYRRHPHPAVRADNRRRRFPALLATGRRRFPAQIRTGPVAPARRRIEGRIIRLRPAD